MKQEVSNYLKLYIKSLTKLADVENEPLNLNYMPFRVAKVVADHDSLLTQ